jgi:hypothetical protein
MWKNLCFLAILTIITSCEKVIDLDLNASRSLFAVEAIMYKDSVCIVGLTRTVNYFSPDEPEYIEDAEIMISDGNLSEVLNYSGNGIYKGNTIIGTPEGMYEIDISQNGINYKGMSYLSPAPVISSVTYNISEEQSHLNPYGERVVDVHCTFSDDVSTDNYYLIRFSDENGKLIERYFLLTENESNSGSIDYQNGEISFSESLFYEGSYIDVKVFSVDKPVYNYFLQISDILFWKRRIVPPTPYNPTSNISNGALGYFAAMSFDSEILILEPSAGKRK